MSSQPKEEEKKTETQNDSHIIFNDYGNFSNLILNNTKKLNAIDYEMSEKMYKIFKGFTKEEKLNFPENFQHLDLNCYKYTSYPKVIYLSANGDHFCSGGDVRSCYDAVKENSGDLLKEAFKLHYTVDILAISMEPILVCEWKGYVMGGGVGVTINAPIRICTDSTVFGMPECQIGYFPDVGCSYFYTHYKLLIIE